MTIPQVYLAVLLAAMAVGQLLSWRRFVDVIGAYGVPRVTATAAALAGSELLAAVLLLPPQTRLGGALVALAVAVAWTTLAIKALVERRRLRNCGCFGGYLRQPLRWWVLLEDAAFVGLAGWVVWQAGGG